MTLKKKVIVGTLATTMAVTAFAGLPLSSKGLAEKLGVGVASAAVATPQQDSFEQKIAAVYAQLLLIPNGKANVKAAYDKALSLSADEIYDAASPVADKLTGVSGANEAQQKAAISKLLQKLFVLSMPPSKADLQDILDESEIQGIVDAFRADLPSVTLTKEDVFGLANEAYSNASNLIRSVDITTLDETSVRNAFVNSMIDSMTSANSAVAKDFANAVIDKYYSGATLADKHAAFKADLEVVASNFEAKIGASIYKPAAKSLALAFIAATNTGGGGGGIPSTGVNLGNVLANLSALKGKLATATDEEKKALIEQAIKDANAVAASLASIDVASLVALNGDNATLSIKSDTVAGLVDGIKKLKAALVDAIGSADGFVVPVASFNLGTLAQPNVTSSAAADVLSKLAEAGIPGVAFTASGLTATLPIDGDFAKGIDFTSKKAAATEDQTKGKTAVSDVYNFSLKLGGSDVEKFAKPITIKFPVKDVAGVDKELLSVARIEADGSLSIQGGSVEGQTISENRHQFSSYVVVENKVNFNDIGTVQAWAGRQIEVVAAKGAIQGKATGVFAPRDDITRAEFAKILVTALDLDNADAMSSKFTDVNSSDWFAPYVAVAVENGIINGRTATSFDPKATITRAEISTMVARALVKVKGVADVADADKALAAFSDAAAINSTLKGGVALAASENIVIGDNGKFRPNDKASRAEAAVMIYRTLNTKAE